MQYVFILGATSDIAVATANRYAKNGYGLYLAARDQKVLEPIATDLSIRHKVDVQCINVDILDIESHASIYEALPITPDGFFCAVGMLGDQQMSEHDMTHCQQVINTNFTGVVSFCNIIANDFAQKKTGFIAVVSSVAGDRGRKANYTYGAAKSGLTTYLSGLRNRLHADGVHVMTIKPGFVATKMTQYLDLPAALTAQPDEVAQAVFSGQLKGRQVVYSKPIWRLIMLIIRHIPESIFKRLSI